MKLLQKLLCKLGRHRYYISNVPQWQYAAISSFGGSYSCYACRAFRWMTEKEEEPWLYPK